MPGTTSRIAEARYNPPMNSLPRPLGSFTNWAILRLGEVVFVVCGLFIVFAQRGRLSILTQAAAVGLIFLLPVYFHPFAFGFADNEGITFCRYFKLHFVLWSEVVRVQRPQWNAFEVVVLLSKRVALTKTVKFPMNLSRQEVDATFRDRWIPETLIWLIDRVASTQPPPTSGPPKESAVRSQKSE